MKKNLLLFLIGAFILNSCGTYYYRNKGKEPVTIDNYHRKDMSSQYFSFFDFILYNNTDNWITVKNIWIQFESDQANNTITLTSGNELKSWFEATQKKKQIEFEENEKRARISQAISAIALAAAEAADEDDPEDVDTGEALGLVIGSALTFNAAAAYNAANEAARAAEVYPDEHLLQPGYKIPPGLFTERWIVFNYKNSTPRTKYIYLKIETDSGDVITKKINLDETIGYRY
ncbi:MAG: hypothetical protein ACLFR2_01655 [Candidatus Kapaibacterium sp.]